MNKLDNGSKPKNPITKVEEDNHYATHRRTAGGDFSSIGDVVNNILTCVTVDPNLENQIGASAQKTEQGTYVSLEPHVMQAFMTNLGTEVIKLTKAGYQPIVLTNPAVRLYFPFIFWWWIISLSRWMA